MHEPYTGEHEILHLQTCPSDEEIDAVDSLLRDQEFEFGDVDSASYMNIYGAAISDSESLKKYVSKNCKTADVSSASLWYFRVVADQIKALQTDSEPSDYDYFPTEDYAAPESLTACRDSQGLLEEYETYDPVTWRLHYQCLVFGGCACGVASSDQQIVA